MFARLIQLCSTALVVCALTASLPAPTLAANDGIVRVKSAYPMGETIARLKKDIADKGIKFFDEIDQSKLAADAGITRSGPPIPISTGSHGDTESRTAMTSSRWRRALSRLSRRA